MAYDEDLADRVRAAIQHADPVTERKMFGGLAFMVAGHMAVAASGKEEGLLLRCDPAQTEVHLRESGIERFVMRGSELNGWLRVDPSAIESDDELARWVAVGVDYAGSLPPK